MCRFAAILIVVRFICVVVLSLRRSVSFHGVGNAFVRSASREWESPSYSRPHFKLRVIPNQFSNWCGNLHRTADCTSNYVSFRTSPLKWCGNLLRHRDCITSKDGDCHASVRYLIAMTGNSKAGIRRRSIQQYASPE